MTTPATSPAPQPAASGSHLSERAKHYRHILGEIVDMGGLFLRITAEDTVQARKVARQTGEPAEMPDYVADYERLTASIRRTVMLDLSLDKPAKPAPTPRVADIAAPAERPADNATPALERPEQPEQERAERLGQERIERPDRLECIRDEDLSHLPVDQGIAIIRRDLDVAPEPAKTAPAKPAAPAAPAAPTQAQQMQALFKTIGETLKTAQRDRFSQGPPAPNIRP